MNGFVAARRGLILALSLAVSATLVRSARAETAVFDKAIHSAAFIVVPKESRKLGYGSGWIADTQRRLLVTNYHVVGEQNQVIAYFPAWERGRLITFSRDLMQGDSPAAGTVIARDRKRDLALVQLDRLPMHVRPLPLAPASPKKDDVVYSIGNSGMASKALNDGSLWHFRTAKVQKVAFRRTKLNGLDQQIEAREVITDAGTSAGDSGGPMVDAQSRLVGVVSHSNEQTKVSGAIAVEEVKLFLDRAVNPGPTPPSPVAGPWTITFNLKEQERFFSLTFKEDGKLIWEADRLFEGTYSYHDGKLTLNVPGLWILNQAYDVTWVDHNRFTFVRNKIEHSASRR